MKVRVSPNLPSICWTQVISAAKDTPKQRSVLGQGEGAAVKESEIQRNHQRRAWSLKRYTQRSGPTLRAKPPSPTKPAEKRFTYGFVLPSTRNFPAVSWRCSTNAKLRNWRCSANSVSKNSVGASAGYLMPTKYTEERQATAGQAHPECSAGAAGRPPGRHATCAGFACGPEAAAAACPASTPSGTGGRLDVRPQHGNPQTARASSSGFSVAAQHLARCQSRLHGSKPQPNPSQCQRLCQVSCRGSGERRLEV